jgi:hypothetical protein
MAATAWQLYNSGKRYIGNGTIELGAGSFKMALFNSASNTSTFHAKYVYFVDRADFGNRRVCFRR